MLSWPNFLKKENIRDKNMKRPNEEGYDPSTLHTHEKELKKMGGLMKQYWSFKSEHFDSVVLFGCCIWYFVYFHDVDIINKLQGKELKTYFHSHGSHVKDREYYINLLTSHGYKVVVVEQTETTL